MMVHGAVRAQLPDSAAQVRQGRLAIYPVLGYAPETKVKMGAVIMYVIPGRSKETFNRPNSLVPYIIYTGNKQLLSSFKTDFYFRNNTYWNNDIRYHNYPDFYYGIGTDSNIEDEEIYTDKFFRDRGRFLKMKGEKLFYGITYDIRYDALSDFDITGQLLFDPSIDRSGGWTNGAGPTVAFDSRDDVYYPSKGSMISASSLFFNKALGSEYIYGTFTFDARHFRNVWNERHVLALQAYVNTVVGNEVPFYRLPQLGGEDRLRGIANENLYRDKSSWYLQVEGRKELFWRFSGVLFAGAGNVSPSFVDQPFRGTKGVAGFGGRFRALKDQKLNLRLDAGIATDGHYAFYISLGEAF